MVAPLALRCTLTVVFAAVGGYCLLRCARRIAGLACHRAGEWLSDVAHVVMSAAMIVMLWTGAGGDPWGVQLTVFAVAAGGFLVRAVSQRHRVSRRGARLGLLHQAVMMAGMVWMIRSMSAPAGAAMSSAASRMSVPGMTASTHNGMTEAALSSTATTLAVAGYLAVAALWWVDRCLSAQSEPAVGSEAIDATAQAESGDRPASGFFGVGADAARQALMAAAMSVALVITL
jgi:hypothetical protein